jgi:thymidine kinase
VLLGEVNEYEPLSRAAFYKAMNEEKINSMDVVDPSTLDPDNNKI